MSTEFPGEADAAGPGTTPGGPLMRTEVRSWDRKLGSCEKLSHLLPVDPLGQDPGTSFQTRGWERRGEREEVRVGKEQKQDVSPFPVPPTPRSPGWEHPGPSRWAAFQATELAVRPGEVCTWKAQLGGLCCLLLRPEAC